MSEHRAHISEVPEWFFNDVEDIVSSSGFEIQKTDETLTIHAPLGVVRMVRNGRGADITFRAASPAQLQLLTDLYAQRLSKMGLDEVVVWASVDARAPLNQTVARVMDKTRISPNFMRLRLEADFAAFARPGAGLHFRLLLSDSAVAWPTLDERGVTQWPGGVGAWHRPPYTVRALAPNADWIDVDIVLHEGGRVTNWCANVELGAEIALHGPSGSTQPKARWLGLVGDETALPVIMRMVEDAPADVAGQAVILIKSIRDMQPVRTQSGIDVKWELWGRQEPTEFIRALAPPAEDYHIFFAGERQHATQVRALFKELGLAPNATKAASYWTADPIVPAQGAVRI
ncbi:MAG: siderophore-interacting protein [Pseudomonadota bacterium]